MNKNDPNDAEVKERVNITIAPHIHDDAVAFAENRGTSFSQLVSNSVLEYMETPTGPKDSFNVQAMTKRLDSLKQGIDQLNEMLETQHEVLDSIATDLGPDAKHTANQIEDELTDAEQPLSLPDLVERLSIKPHEIEEGLRHLESGFAIERIDSSNSEISVPRWELL